MAEELMIRAENSDIVLHVKKGHFATMHSHTNYFVDVTTQKMNLAEAKTAAKELVERYRATTVIDSILCIDGMEVIGTCIADELTSDNYINVNANHPIYVLSPEYISGGQIMFRDNLMPMIVGKNVLVLAASVTTGKSALAAMDAINYYGGKVVGVAAIFATVGECDNHPVSSIFDPNDLGDYQSFKPNHCPFCDEGKRIEALINSYGYSAI